MTKDEARGLTKDARQLVIENIIHTAADNGEYSVELASLNDEQKEYLSANGFEAIPKDTKQGTLYLIKW